MTPQPKEGFPISSVDESDFALVPDEEYHEPIEERKLELNIKGTIHNLRNLDYSKVRWRNVILFTLLHVYSVYGVYLVFQSCMWKTIFFAYVLYYVGMLGSTMGAHRLWSHRSFKAILPVRLTLAVFQTIAFQNDIYEWARDHRVHHKFSETNADPHNAKRGLFFSHMGWLMYRKHSDVAQKGKTLDLSDLLADPVVKFQRKFYLPSVFLCCFVLPTVIPWYFWSENVVTSLVVAGFLRYCVTLHLTWNVNSLAHFTGLKPFDRFIHSSQNKFVSYFALGEGWHNYHHTFPFDYRTDEMGGNALFNQTTVIINCLAKIGWTYDLKAATVEMYEKRAKRTGDGSHKSSIKTKCQ